MRQAPPADSRWASEGLDAGDRRRVRDLTRELRTITEGAPPVLSTLVREVRELCGAPQVVAHGFSLAGDRLSLDFFWSSGIRPEARLRADFAQFLRGTPPVGWTYYNPVWPEPCFRNEVFDIEQLRRRNGGGEPPIADELKRWGLPVRHLRVLVCDGPALLAWVGIFPVETSGERERRILSALTPALQRRLKLERQLQRAPVAWTALETLLDDLPGAAFLVRDGGVVVLANQAGRILMEQGSSTVQAALARSLDPSDPTAPYQVVRLTAPGTPLHYLATLRVAPTDETGRLRRAAQVWKLTPRQAEVLTLVARGSPNRTIAVTLHCSEKTVEAHLTALLSKADCGSRSELVARFWGFR